jgi:hypothetical protein
MPNHKDTQLPALEVSSCFWSGEGGDYPGGTVGSART